jgi:hypothetical protein
MANPELEGFIDDTIKVSHAHGYNPTVFISMRFKFGTVAAITKLVESPDLQSGFKRLKELGLLDHTIEAAVIRFPQEFSPPTRECAEFRLRIV